MVKFFTTAMRRRELPFLLAMWPLVSAMRLLGWLPAARRGRGLAITRGWTLLMLLTLLLQVTPLIFIVYRGLQLMVSGLDTELYVLMFVTLGALTLLTCIAPLAAVTARRHVNFCNQLAACQLQLEKLTHSRLDLSGLRVSCLSVPPLLVLPYLGTMVVRPLALGVPPGFTIDLYIPLGAGNLTLLVAWWLAVHHVLAKLARALTEATSQEISRLSPSPACCHELCRLWLRLSSVSSRSGHALGPALACSLVYHVAFFSLHVYEVTTQTQPGPVLFFLALILYEAAFLVLVCAAAHRSTAAIHSGLMECLAAIPSMHTSNELNLQLTKFLTHLSQRSPKVTLMGYVTLGRPLLSTVAVGLVSNLAVLTQLRIPERRFTTRDFYTFGSSITYT